MHISVKLSLFIVGWASKGLGFIELRNSLCMKSFWALGQQIKNVLQSCCCLFFFFFLEFRYFQCSKLFCVMVFILFTKLDVLIWN